MVGQTQNLFMIEEWRMNRQFPRFMIITGERGSGKKELAYAIGLKIPNCITVMAENGVEAVREIIQTSYRCNTPTCYIFRDADKMSPQAKNALLKVTEEPPRQAYFIMTIQSMDSTLATLKSRGTEIKMAPYTKRELWKLCKDPSVLAIASTPGQIKQLEAIDTKEFLNFCDLLLHHLGSVSGVNAFKSATRVSFKEEQEGYDVVLTLDGVRALAVKELFENRELPREQQSKYVQTLFCCSKFRNELSITGIKKDATFDMWVLKMREIWQEEE